MLWASERSSLCFLTSARFFLESSDSNARKLAVAMPTAEASAMRDRCGIDEMNALNDCILAKKCLRNFGLELSSGSVLVGDYRSRVSFAHTICTLAKTSVRA